MPEYILIIQKSLQLSLFFVVFFVGCKDDYSQYLHFLFHLSQIKKKNICIMNDCLYVLVFYYYSLHSITNIYYDYLNILMIYKYYFTYYYYHQINGLDYYYFKCTINICHILIIQKILQYSFIFFCRMGDYLQILYFYYDYLNILTIYKYYLTNYYYDQIFRLDYYVFKCTMNIYYILLIQKLLQLSFYIFCCTDNYSQYLHFLFHAAQTENKNICIKNGWLYGLVFYYYSLYSTDTITYNDYLNILMAYKYYFTNYNCDQILKLDYIYLKCTINMNEITVLIKNTKVTSIPLTLSIINTDIYKIKLSYEQKNNLIIIISIYNLGAQNHRNPYLKLETIVSTYCKDNHVFDLIITKPRYSNEFNKLCAEDKMPRIYYYNYLTIWNMSDNGKNKNALIKCISSKYEFLSLPMRFQQIEYTAIDLNIISPALWLT